MRNNTFDVMKGIGIIAMIVGHSPIPKLLESFIFVWHMPLFFLVSGYFYKSKSEAEYIKRNARQLVLPYALTALVMIMLTATKQLVIRKGDSMTMLISAMVGNGSGNNPIFSDYNIGAIWFLLAMFWCRSSYNILQVRISNPLILGGAILLLSIIATYVGTIIYLPTDILEGAEALLFFYIGHMSHENDEVLKKIHISKWFILIVVLLTGLSIHAGSMSMVRCYYGYWPVNYLAAIGMTVMVYYLSKCLRGNRFLTWCGRVSMVILCVHIIELNFFPMGKFHEIIPFNNDSIDVFIHLSNGVLFSWIILRLRFVKRLFSIA